MKLAPQEIRTFFVTSATWGRRPIFRSQQLAELFLDTCFRYREQSKYELHEFVLMPDHFHLLITPAAQIPLERAVQFIKGGFSYRVKHELASNLVVWQETFTNHRIRDANDYAHHRDYILSNPVRAGLVTAPERYAYSSANPEFRVDPAPPGLKPDLRVALLSQG